MRAQRTEHGLRDILRQRRARGVVATIVVMARMLATNQHVLPRAREIHVGMSEI